MAAPKLRQRATLAGFAGMFLSEIARANSSFAGRRLELARQLANPVERAALVRALGGEQHSEALNELLVTEAAQAAELGIVEVHVTFWLEPARPNCWESIVRFFRWLFRRTSPDAFAGVYQLAPASRREHAAQYEMTIRRARDVELAATSPRLLQAASAATLERTLREATRRAPLPRTGSEPRPPSS